MVATKCSAYYLFVCACFAGLMTSLCCPEQCSCKWKNGKKTADCSDRNLIMIPAHIEPETQVLEINGNDLQELKRYTFKNSGLINLQRMSMRACHLGQIDQYAFRELVNLVEIDLSQNLLTHVPSQAFDDVQYLRILNLAHNPITRIEAFAFKSTPQLTRLDLSGCNIQTVRPNAFDGLDVLESLKLSENKLEELPAEAVNKLNKLRTIELHGNNWICDCHMRGLKMWLNDFGVHVPQPVLCLGGPERLKNEVISNLDSEDFACKPSIKTDARHIEAIVGTNITIECRVESDPGAKIIWYFEDAPLSNNTIFDTDQRIMIIDVDDDPREKRSRLVVNRVQELDAGEYHCIADNRAGSAQANFTIRTETINSGIYQLNSSNINLLTLGLGAIIIFMLVVIALLIKRIAHSSFPDDDKHVKAHPHPEKNSIETSSQKSHDSEIKSDSGKAFTVTSDLSYSRSLSDIGNPQFSNPDLISGTNMRDSTCITPLPTLPIMRPISDYCQNWQKSYAMPRAASSSGFNYGEFMQDRLPPMVVDTVSAGSGSDEVFTHSRMSNDYPPDYGLPILSENAAVTQPCAKTLKVWQRGVPVYPPMCSGPPPPAFHQIPPHVVRISPPTVDRPYQRCGTDV